MTKSIVVRNDRTVSFWYCPIVSHVNLLVGQHNWLELLELSQQSQQSHVF